MTTQLAVWNFPHYVVEYFGKPMTFIQTKQGRYRVSGPRYTLMFSARNAAHARLVIKDHVVRVTKTIDERILRHHRQED